MSDIYVDRRKAKKQEEEETLPSSMAMVEGNSSCSTLIKSEELILYFNFFNNKSPYSVRYEKLS